MSLEVARLWREQGFAPNGWDCAAWVADNDRQMKRHDGPALDRAWQSVDGFYLIFGQGVCLVYHLLRWQFRLKDPAWQRAMTRSWAAVGSDSYA